MKQYTRTAYLALMLLIGAGAELSAQTSRSATGNVPAQGSWQQLATDASRAGKPAWRPMLTYVAGLHQKGTHPAAWPFDYEWEDLGPGYVYGNAFGHWDVVHETLDVLPSYPEHALHQLLNDIKNQEPNGLLPGSIYMPGGMSGRDSVTWNKNTQGHPPLWPLAVQDYVKLTKDSTVIKTFYTPLVRQIAWFENTRKAEGEGFFYNDILLKKWESGVDEGIRFDEVAKGALACVDATSHVFALYQMAAKWARQLGLDASYYEKRTNELRTFIQTGLYVPADGMFYDSWAVKDPALRNLPFESMWPLVTGAATQEQANRYIDNYLLNKSVFLTDHPIATVGRRDPKFELRMWRGPAWNSMAYWAARGCLNYGRKDAAKVILEKALDDSAKQFKRTGTIWEFYHPLGGKPEDVKRKPNTKYNTPCRDYLGHNPLIEMARLYDSVK
ncbi:MGH1-like glycoside hydrolase domain-containing protein [Hymenobacter sp. GOD-10R]|uniref:MGH1-like glycoside hydrolase domain-containing protein n=1 Tax=Hymenobacter sp. GOD-10R TaxID=3093922 RepID=UPI002D79AA2C|nr:trehalase family glycosidase [Hymenobacter sp. GOD-10R]WRQ28991.1 trehalase family glycosidase [Hymenobacter sp. GOD-10R]